MRCVLIETHGVDEVREGDVEPGMREHLDLLHLLHVLSWETPPQITYKHDAECWVIR